MRDHRQDMTPAERVAGIREAKPVSLGQIAGPIRLSAATEARRKRRRKTTRASRKANR